MKTFDVIEKATGKRVDSYQADAPIEFVGGEFALYEHRELVAADLLEVPGAITVYGGRRKLTKLEWRKLLTDEENKAFDKLRATVETMPLPSEELRDEIRTAMNKFDEATVMDLDDPEQARGFGLMVALGKMAPNRISEILNG